MNIGSKLIVAMSICLFGCLYGRPVHNIRLADSDTVKTRVTSPEFDTEKRDTDEIYTILLNQGFVQTHLDVIGGRTVAYSKVGPSNLDEVIEIHSRMNQRRKKRSTTVGRDLRDDFIRQNAFTTVLSFPRELEEKFTIVSEDDLKSIFAHADGWAEFRIRFPEANLLEFSKIGFSRTRTEALVYMSRSGGLKNGGGSYYLFLRQNEKWVIKDIIEAWVS